MDGSAFGAPKIYRRSVTCISMAPPWQFDTIYGHSDLDRFCLSYLAAFPSGVFKVESAFVNRDPGQPVRVTMRWSLNGAHAGFGRFGAPTGAPVYVMGMNHAYMVDGRVTAEWIVTDEIAIWKQILVPMLLEKEFV
jgi:SnoaL-like polyketide cyclase